MAETYAVAHHVASFNLGDASISYASVADAVGVERFASLPLSLRILAENILRKEPDEGRRLQCLEAIASADDGIDLPFRPERVVLQDMLGTALLTDLAALRDEVAEAGGDASLVNPSLPTHFVVDHSLNVDAWGVPDAQARNEAIERERNAERFRFMDWASLAFDNFSIISSGSGILHQINLERLTPVVALANSPAGLLACPDTLVGTDSHTPMINAIGVLGWGVGGLEAEVAMLGKPLMMRLPETVGIRLEGQLRPGILATDLALTLAEFLRGIGVVGAFVEFHGPGLASLPLADRATVANMAPEYGATAALFPIDERTIEYMKISGRDAASRALTEGYARAQGLWADELGAVRYSRSYDFDLASVERVIAGPRQPHERIAVGTGAIPSQTATPNGAGGELPKRPVVIAAITSCTNTSNPRTILTAALLARNARARGLTVPRWVRTSFAPGSRVVSDYLQASGLQKPLDELGFTIIGFGCTTCNGLSGPQLPEELQAAITAQGATAVGVTSGNRNFEGRVHPQAREVFIMSPPLIVAYAIAGSDDADISLRPLGVGSDGRDIFLSDLWPSDEEVEAVEKQYATAASFERGYREIDEILARGRERRREAGKASRFEWDKDSTYIRRPPYWSLSVNASPKQLRGLRPLVILGDHITTDHISPTGTILPVSDTGIYLDGQGVAFADFNSYGSRRGNFEAAERATFASPRLKNEMLADGAEGPLTVVQPVGERQSIYRAAKAYAYRDTGLIVVAGKNYGSGSSRDWAAKGPRLLGVRVVLAESFERIHRQNLAAIGILPLQFMAGESRKTLRLNGAETFDILGLERAPEPRQEIAVRIHYADGRTVDISTICRLDTAEDVSYFLHGGLLPQLKTEILAQSTSRIARSGAGA